MFHIVLHEPKIAPNTGNIIRLAANNGCHLHLIEPLGFDLDEKKLRRAGLDYHDMVNVTKHESYEVFLQSIQSHRIFACTTKGQTTYDQVEYRSGDVLLFGSETHGLPEGILNGKEINDCIRIPMMSGNRSLNLSNAVAIVSFEAWRQLGYKMEDSI